MMAHRCPRQAVVQRHKANGLERCLLGVELSRAADQFRIADAAKFRALAYQAIGNHRSYGLGSVSCDALEAAPPSVADIASLELDCV